MKVDAVDIFVQSAVLPRFDDLEDWSCTHLYNRGTEVSPQGKITCHMTDIFQCRFNYKNADASLENVTALVQALTQKGVRWSEVHVIWADFT